MKRIACVLTLLYLFQVGNASLQTSFHFDIRGKTQQLQLYGPENGNPILLSSGDLGWAGLVVHVAEFLCSREYRIVGLNSREYLASFTTRNSALNPADVPRDFKSLIDGTLQKSSVKPILVGISEGAGLSVLAATDPAIRASVQGILGLGLPDQNELGWKWQDFTIWITKRAPNEPSFKVEDIIGKISPTPLAEIHSTHDEFLPLEQAKSMFARAGEPKRMWVIEAANHRFSDNRDELDHRILEALDWIRAQKSSVRSGSLELVSPHGLNGKTPQSGHGAGLPILHGDFRSTGILYR